MMIVIVCKRVGKLFINQLVIFALLFYYSTTPVLATYSDSFNGSFDNLVDWTIWHGYGKSFTDNTLKLSESSPRSFPYITNLSISPLSEQDYYEIRFKYDFAGGFGTGISLTNEVPLSDTVMTYPSKFYQYSIFYVWQNNLSPYFHIMSSICPSSNINCPAGVPIKIYQSNSVDIGWHILRIQRITNHYMVYLDENQIFESADTNRNIDKLWIGNPETTQTTNTWSSFEIDYFKHNFDSSSIIPYLSQRNDKWKDFEYDSANVWAGSEANSIERWGCALTSVAMVLQKYNIKMPDGSIANPDILNTWLKGQDDGYVGNGLLNWLAVSRLVRQSLTAGNSNTDLEFIKSSGTPSEEITAGLYPIVNTGSHFVVTHGQDSTNYQINDPFEASRSAIGKSQNLASINTFYPSNTDLSNIMIVGSNNLIATMSGSSGAIQVESFDESITDDLGGGRTQIRSYYFNKPTSDVYRLLLNNNAVDAERSDLYLYDSNGIATKKEIMLLPGETKTIVINYDKAGVQQPTIIELDTTPPPTPANLSPIDNTYAKPSNLTLSWDNVSDPSLPITYWYKSSWNGGSYGPVSTGANSYINASGSADREYTWYVKACDSATNCSGWSSGTKLIVDSVKPSVDLVFPTPGPDSTYFDVVFSEKMKLDNVSNPANYFLNNWPGAGGSGDLVGDATIEYNENTKTARISFSHSDWYISPEQQWGVGNVEDLAGNILSPNPTMEYSTPLLTPSTPIVTTLLPEITNSSNQNWSWSSNDSGSGIKGYYERIYDVLKLLPGEWIWAGNILGASTSLSDGVWQLNVQAVDNAGNISEIGSSKELAIDTIAPDPPLLLSPADAVVTNGKYVLQDWSESVGASKYIYESYNDPLLKILRYRGTFTNSQKDASNIAESTYWWRVAAVDQAGNQSDWSEVRKIVIDNTAPKLVGKTNFSGWYSNPQTSFFDYTDPNIIPGYLAPNCELTTHGYAQTCQVIPNVCDQAGNCNTIIQTSNPCDIDQTAPKTLLNAWGSTIDGTASDLFSGVERTEIKITNPNNASETVRAVGSENWSFTMSESPLGNYKIVVASYDKAGNKGDEIVKEFVMSESARSTQVLGANTKKIDERSEMTEVRGEIRDERSEKQEEQVDSGEMREVVDDESVLGEKTENKSKNWWWLVMIPFCVAIFWISTKLFGE